MPLTFFAVISPLPILQLFPRFKKRFWPYLLVQSLSVLLLIIGLIIADSPKNEDVLNLLAPIPTAALFAFTTHNDSVGSISLLKAAFISDAVLLAWVLYLVYRQFRIVRKPAIQFTQEGPTILLVIFPTVLPVQNHGHQCVAA